MHRRGQRFLVMRFSGRYEIERTLGRGGMATVHLAHDHVLGRHVALKVLAERLAEDERFRARFLREARLAARISHPNVVRVFDAVEDGPRLAIALEYVEGETLAEELARRGRLPPDEVAELGLQLAAALAAAHDAGLVHRDVKPQNVLRAADGTTKLGDFGIARSHDSTALTEAGSVLGTAAYLAPEQARGEPVTGATDLYALGVVLFQALTGRLPHTGSTLAELVLARERDQPTAPSSIVEGVPPELERAILSCLAPRPEHRPASAAMLAAELAAPAPTLRLTPAPDVPAASVTTAATAVVHRAPPRFVSTGALLALLTLAAVAGLATVLAISGGDPSNEPSRAFPLLSGTTMTSAPVTTSVRREPVTASTQPSRTPAATAAPTCAQLEQRRAELEALKHALREQKKGHKGKEGKSAREAVDAQKHALDDQRKELDRERKDVCANDDRDDDEDDDD